MNFIVIQPRITNTIDWMNSVALRFMAAISLRFESREPAVSVGLHERVRGREPQRDADADDERRVDQAEQQEDLGLQHVHQLRLARRGFDVLAGHDTHADAGADGADTDDQAAGECDKTDVRHSSVLSSSGK